MYARSTTLKGSPANVDAGIAYVKDEVWPMLEQIEGCRGISILVDRDTGHCIVTSSWESEETMRASDEQLRPNRERGRDILGGSMEVDEWEIAVMPSATAHCFNSLPSRLRMISLRKASVITQTS